MANALSSMTGYARAQGGVPGISFSVEIKTVNSRGLDIRIAQGEEGIVEGIGFLVKATVIVEKIRVGSKI